MPVASDILMPVKDDGDVAIARTRGMPIECDQSIPLPELHRSPLRTNRRPRQQDAAQSCKMRRRIVDGGKSTDEKSKAHGPSRDIGTLDHQLERRPVAAQHQMLAALGIDEDVLEAGHRRNEHARLSGRGTDSGHRRCGKCRCADLREPDGAGPNGVQGGVGESSGAPTLRQQAQGPASA